MNKRFKTIDPTHNGARHRSGREHCVELPDEDDLPSALLPAPANCPPRLTLPVSGENSSVLALTAEPLYCEVDLPAAWLYPQIAQRLAAVGDVYRLPGGGLVVVPQAPDVPPMEVTNGGLLGAVIKDRIPLVLVKNGKLKGSRLPPADLNDMVRCKLFLDWFQTIDRVAVRPEYVGEFELTQPGYNDGGVGHRVYYTGSPAEVVRSRDAIDRFLDVMAFASNADRTNAVGAALTVLLRHFWAGQKPVILATSTKSHGGKDTVLDFAAGDTPNASISYETADWANQRAFVEVAKENPTLGFVRIENVRLDSTGKQIASAFLERFVADENPVLHATGTGKDKPARSSLPVSAASLLIPTTTNRAADFFHPSRFSLSAFASAFRSHSPSVQLPSWIRTNSANTQQWSAPSFGPPTRRSPRFRSGSPSSATPSLA